MRIRFLIVDHLMMTFIIMLALLICIVLLIIGTFYIDTTALGTGILKCKDWVDIKPEIGGIIKQIYVVEGQSIKQGDVLFELEDRERKLEVQTTERNITDLKYEIDKINKKLLLSKNTIKSAVEEARANLSTAKSKYQIVEKGPKPEEIYLAETRIQRSKRNLEKARKDHLRLQKAFSLKIISEMQLEEANYRVKISESDLQVSEDELNLVKNKYDTNQVAAAKGEVERCKAVLDKEIARRKELEILQTSLYNAHNAMMKEKEKLLVFIKHLNLARVCAPINGYVLTHDMEHMAGKSVTRGQTILRIGGCGEFIIDCKVSERDFPLIKEGQSAKVQITPYPKGEYKLFEAEVAKVGTDIKIAEPVTEDSILHNQYQDVMEGYYPVILSLLKPYYIFIYGKKYIIKPGFSAEVEIVTGKERIISFILRKVLRIKGKLTQDNIHL